MVRRPETALQIVAAQFLDYALPEEAIWTAMDAGLTKLTPAQADLQKRKGVKKGWPDLLVMYRGKLHGIELKAPKGRVSPEQHRIGAALIDQGGHWCVAKSIADIEENLHEWGIPLRATNGTKFAPRQP
jgi:hypothetical protein